MATTTGTPGADNLVGTDADDTLQGLGGNDQLTGGKGADALDGGSGVDTARYDGSATFVSVDLLLNTGFAGDAAGDTLLGVENATGSAFGDTIRGNNAANVLRGLAGGDRLDGAGGDDRLAGGAGADQLFGDTGVDTADYSAAKAGVVASLNLGGLAGEASGDTYSSVENLTGSAFNDNLQGDSAANLLAAGGGADVLGGLGGDDILKGGAGDEFLQGGAGADTLDGGTGVDTASYRNSGVGVQVSLSPGVAALNGDAQGDVLVSIENLEGSDGGADTLSGTDGANVLEGRGGFDSLFGGGGNDILRGGAGADNLDGGAGVDTASYSDSNSANGVLVNLGAPGPFADDGDTLSGIENVESSEQSDVLLGGGGANVLMGRGGDDTLIGQGGRDVLTGGLGADNFLYRAVGDSLPGTGRDRITDFSHAQLDKLALHEMDADPGQATDQAFSFIGKGAFSAAGQARFFFEGDHTVVELNTTGSTGAEAQIELAGNINLVAGDFLL